MKKRKLGFLAGILFAALSLPVGVSAAEQVITPQYGTVDLTWEQFYGNDNFDAITSATTNFRNSIEHAESELTEDESGTVFTGVKSVPVQVSAELYNSVNNKDEKDELTSAEQLASKVDYNEDQTEPSWYLTLTESGLVGITKADFSEKTTDVPVESAEIEAPSAWGDYCILVNEETPKYLGTGRTFSGEINFTNLLGATFTAEKDGKETVYTLGYLENLWTATYEFSFRIAKDTPMVHMGDSTNYEQFKDIAGSEITALTYYTTDGIYNFDLSSCDLKVKNQVPEGAVITGDSEVKTAEDGSISVKIDISKLPAGFEMASVGRSNGHGNTNVAEGKYSYQDGVLTITADGVEAVGGSGSYEAIFADSTGTYVNVEYAFNVVASETPSTPETPTTPSTGTSTITPTTPSTSGTTGNTTTTQTSSTTGTAVKKGSTYTVGNYKYKVTKVATSKASGTVTVTAAVKKSTSISIPKTVKIKGKSYKVTAVGANAFKGNTKATKITIGANVTTIGKNAFYNCKKVKSVTISSKKLTSKKVGAGAFKKLGASNYKKVTVKVPSSKLKAYKTILKKAGLSSKAKVKK